MAHRTPLLIFWYLLVLVTSVGRIERVAAETAEKWMTEAIDLYRRGHFREAVARFATAGDVYDRQGSLSDKLNASIWRARTNLALGQPQEAVTGLHLALRLLRDTTVEREEASILGLLGAAYMQTGNIDEAKRHLNASIRKGRERNDINALATSTNNLGNLLELEGRYRASLDSYHESTRLAEQARNHKTAAKALANAARIAIIQPGQELSLIHI